MWCGFICRKNEYPGEESRDRSADSEKDGGRKHAVPYVEYFLSNCFIRWFRPRQSYTVLSANQKQVYTTMCATFCDVRTSCKIAINTDSSGSCWQAIKGNFTSSLDYCQLPRDS